MDTECFTRCETFIKNAMIVNMDTAPNQIKGHVWIAIGDDPGIDPDLTGPFRYQVPAGMDCYMRIIHNKLTDDNKKKAQSFINDCKDFMVFVHCEKQTVIQLTM